MKFLFSAVVLLFLASCGGADTNTKTDGTASTPPTSMVAPADSLSSNPVYTKGTEMVNRFQCLVCHKVEEKLTGPSYRDVANKYANANADTIAKLAKKIIDGGVGVWGEVPMTPHPNVSMDDAKAMVEYILLLKK